MKRRVLHTGVNTAPIVRVVDESCQFLQLALAIIGSI